MKYYLFGLLAVFAVLACENNEEYYKVNEKLLQLRADWEREYAAWQVLDIQKYRFSYWPDNNSFGTDKNITITVKNGNFYSALYREKGREEYFLEGYLLHGSNFTINDYFMMISNTFDMIENGPENPDVIYVSINVSYDPEYRFPAIFYYA